MYYYHVYNFTIASEILLYGLPEIDKCDADVYFLYKEVPTKLKNSYRKRDWQALPNNFLLRVNGVASYLVTKNTIHIERCSQSRDVDICIFLLGSALGALLHLRGILPLHASGIATEKGAILFAAKSGTGKSTLSIHFAKKNYPLITDDIAGIIFCDNIPYAIPSFPIIKLWEKDLHSFGLESHTFFSRGTTKKKYLVPIKNFCRKPLPIQRIYAIERNQCNTVCFPTLESSEKFEAIMSNIYRKGFLVGLALQKPVFDNVSKIIQKTDVVKILRPKNIFSLQEISQRIEADLQE